MTVFKNHHYTPYLVMAVVVVGVVAGPGTLGTAPGGPPGPCRGVDGSDEGSVSPGGL